MTRAEPRARPCRNLVVLRAGDGSLHREWIAAPRRDFDLFISYYGRTPGRWQEDADHYEMRAGPKWPALAELLDEQAELIAAYDCVWFPDDDLSVQPHTLDRMFAFFHAHQLQLAQPALTRNSFHTWNTLLQDPHSQLRYTRFVEVMAPLFSRAALGACQDTFAQSHSGWGLDWTWPVLCERAGLSGIAVIDATPVWHTRPLGGELYRNHALDPRADAARVLSRYGLQEVRAVAKYSVLARVQAVPLSLRERLVFWLKRLNGRRKLRRDQRRKLTPQP
ncbi:DUF707 domain-containing protein [Azohydromonas aeria]|uniref:DUF707 domain-containing protein n=1 Tax=Azohydromonas aeria TaxID=2590212 RepID=UPI0012F77907|nr:DUF707 domain-containing protein [Azohydromonas aeria]